MIFRHSLILRITSFFVFVSIVVIGALSLVINDAINDHFIEQDLDVINEKLNIIEEIIKSNSIEQLPDKLSKQFNLPLDRHHTLVAQIKYKGSILFSSNDVNFPTVNRIVNQNTSKTFNWEDHSDSYRGIYSELDQHPDAGNDFSVLIALDIHHHNHFFDSFNRTLVTFMLLAILLSGLLGWFATRRGLMPLTIMTNRAKTVSLKHLDKRMPQESLPIEIADLAQTLNQMLDRLESAFTRLSDFSSDIAHELRTPISNLMTQTHVALSKSRTTEEYQQVLASNSEEFERLSRMIADMLYLSKSEHELLVIPKGTVNLTHIVTELFDFYDALAEDRNISLILTGHAEVKGDDLMLRRALSNLLSNAIRHSNANSHVAISLLQTSNEVRITVKNHGESIPESDQLRLFERFYRADKSRTTDNEEGTGLGLAITKSIVEVHYGKIYVSSSDGETCFTVKLPK